MNIITLISKKLDLAPEVAVSVYNEFKEDFDKSPIQTLLELQAVLNSSCGSEKEDIRFDMNEVFNEYGGFLVYIPYTSYDPWDNKYEF